jgi:cbb3-type cytochrome oxidase subunit 3
MIEQPLRGGQVATASAILVALAVALRLLGLVFPAIIWLLLRPRRRAKPPAVLEV